MCSPATSSPIGHGRTVTSCSSPAIATRLMPFVSDHDPAIVRIEI
jgi:hypothetical protein